MSRQVADPDGAWPVVSRPELVGREREQRLLLDAVEQTIGGQGGLTLVSGEAGIGKTTLVEDLLERAAERGALVLSGGCYDLTTTPPYGPWVEILREYSSRESERDELPALPDQLQVGGGMAGIDSQAALFDLVGRFLSGVAAVQPLVILLEDLHWSDPASLDLLRYLARTLGDDPVLLMATYRDDEITREHPLFALLPALVREGRAQRLELQRIEPEAVRAIVRQRYRLGSEDETRLLGYLDGLAEGNPFFVHELLYTLEGQRLLVPVAGGWQLGDLSEAGVPSLIQQVIDGRLARLDPPTRDLLEAAAVIGYDASLELLFELQGGASVDLDAALQQAVDHHLLRLSTVRRLARFSHALVRQAIYEEIPFLQRQELHRRTGEALTTRARPDPAPVANHFYEAGDERALEWLERAAEQAQSLFAPGSVIDHASRGIDLATRLNLDAPLGLYRLRGLARESLGDFDGARSDHELVLEHARERGDLHAEWQSLLDLGALWASRDYQQTRTFYERAVALAREMVDPATLGHSLNRLGNWYVNAESTTKALRHHQEALDIFQEIHDSDGIARSFDFIALDYFMIGDLGRALQYYEKAVPMLRSIDEQQTLSSSIANTAMASWGDWASHAGPIYNVPQSIGEDVTTCLDEAIEIAQSIEWRSGEAYALSGKGLMQGSRGGLRSGLRAIAEGLAIAEQIQHHQWRTQIYLRFGAIFLALGTPNRARPHLQQALEIADAISSSFFTTGATGLLASACIQDGDVLIAESLLLHTIDQDPLGAMFSSRTCWFANAELELAQNRPNQALDTVDRLIGSIPGDSGVLSPELLRLRGEILVTLDRSQDAESQFAEARASAEQSGLQLILWRILATQRKLYLAQGRVEDADNAGDAALRIINELANQLDDEELRAEFLTNARAQIPGTVPYRPDREEIYAGLTPRELEVLRAVAEGLTDAEAGERLFIATRTVSQHLRSVYNKLGVNNRAAAVRIAVEQGLV